MFLIALCRVSGDSAPVVPNIYQHHTFFGQPGPFFNLSFMKSDDAWHLMQNIDLTIQQQHVVFSWRSWPNNYYHSVSSFNALHATVCHELL